MGHLFGSIQHRVALQNAGVQTYGAHRRLPGHHRPRHHGEHPGQRLQHGDGLHRRRHRPGEDAHLRALRHPGVQPAHAAVPLPRVRGGAAAQPHGQGRDGGVRPPAHGPAADLSGAPGVRHPVLQGQRRAGGQGPAAAHRGHAQDRPRVQRALRQRVPRAGGPALRRHRDSGPGRPQDVEELRQLHHARRHRRRRRRSSSRRARPTPSAASRSTRRTVRASPRC